jgi:cysteine desulfurase/selenocysteine lyase
MSECLPFDVKAVRNNFICLERTVRSKPLIYFDNAATAQKPDSVVRAMNEYYQFYTANINRGPHFLSELASEAYNKARARVASFLNTNIENIIFTRGATESINLVAHCLGKICFNPNDEIILTEAEHHANIVPWFLLAKEKGLNLRVARIFDDGSLDLENFASLFNERTKLVAFTHISNILGIINPINEIVHLAKKFGAITLIDGAQAVPHVAVDMAKIDADFYCFSGHKIYGPTGIGVLYAKSHFIETMPPYQSGGDMIKHVSFDDVSFKNGPHKFEAGTPNIAGALGLKAALDYIENLGIKNIYSYEEMLLDYLTSQLNQINGIKIIGTTIPKIPLVSFTLNGIHPHDVSTILDRQGIAIRSGHLCAEPLMKRLQVNSVSRASLSFYNTIQEIDHFIKSINKIYEVFNK